MKKIIFSVEGMSCQHCVNAVKNAVSVLDGVSCVDVNLEEKIVAVECDKTPLELIQSEIEDQGFEVTQSTLSS